MQTAAYVMDTPLFKLLFKNWWGLMPGPGTPVLLTFVAVLCGAIVGSEREKREKPAGMRTLIMVVLGAAAFTMVSFAFTTTTGDSGRVAAQIVTGIGFLGAGVIMRGNGTVRGTTTAATIWMMAAIGVAAGSGYAAAAIGLSVVVRGVLAGIYVWESSALQKLPPVHVRVDYEPDKGKTRVHIECILMNFSVHAPSCKWLAKGGEDGLDRLMLTLHLAGHHVAEALNDIASEPAVKSMEVLTKEEKK